MYEKIVVGIDASKYSQAAVMEVAAWLKKHGGKAELVHGVYFDEEEFGLKPELLSQRLEAGREICQRSKELAREFGVEMDCLVREGDPHEVLVQQARQNQADLIALGTYGRKRLSRLIMGSVTAKVIVDAPRSDVLVVRRPCDECGGRYHSILVPFDNSPSSRKALASACRLARQDQTQVRALYVIPRYEELLGFFKTAAIEKSLRQEAAKVLEQAKEEASRLGCALETECVEGQAADQILAVAESRDCDLIIMGSSGWSGIDRTLMGSTAERVIMTAQCPVLVTKADA